MRLTELPVACRRNFNPCSTGRLSARLHLTAVLLFFGLGLALSSPVPAQDSVDRPEDTQLETIEVFADRVVEDTSIGRNLLDVREMGRSIQVIDNSLIETVKPVAIDDILFLSSNMFLPGRQRRPREQFRRARLSDGSRFTRRVPRGDFRGHNRS